MKISPYIIYLEMQPNALLLQQNFDSQKVSVTMILVFIWFQELRYQIRVFQGMTKWSWPNVKIIITAGVYLTRGPSALDPRLSRLRGWPVGQGLTQFGPSLGCHASTRGGEGQVSGESQRRPLDPAGRPRGLAVRPPPGAKPTSPNWWRSHSPL
jgi:hypothetical protein